MVEKGTNPFPFSQPFIYVQDVTGDNTYDAFELVAVNFPKGGNIPNRNYQKEN